MKLRGAVREFSRAVRGCCCDDKLAPREAGDQRELRSDLCSVLRPRKALEAKESDSRRGCL